MHNYAFIIQVYDIEMKVSPFCSLERQAFFQIRVLNFNQNASTRHRQIFSPMTPKNIVLDSFKR